MVTPVIYSNTVAPTTPASEYTVITKEIWIMIHYKAFQWLFFFYMYCFFGWCFESAVYIYANPYLSLAGFSLASGISEPAKTSYRHTVAVLQYITAVLSFVLSGQYSCIFN